MKTTVGLHRAVAGSARSRRTRLRGARGRSAVWLLALLGAGLSSLARGQVVTEFPIPTAFTSLSGIAAGPDGNLWFTESALSCGLCNPLPKIGRITTAGAVTRFSADGVGIAAGPDGNLWFTEYVNCSPFCNPLLKIGRITTAGVVVNTFQVLQNDSGPGQIAAGPDGNLWFTEFAPVFPRGHKIGRITTAGVISEFPTPDSDSNPYGIAAGPDGNLWFTESYSGANKIGRITTTGVITEFPIPTAGSVPLGIAAGPDGNLWFVESATNQIGRITVAGFITEFPIPTAGSNPRGIAAGPDGNLWFTESDANQIGRITAAGVVTEFPIPTAGSKPGSITPGPDGNLWFTEAGANSIGRITTGPTIPQRMAVDARSVPGSISNANGVLEPGETVQIAPSWKNTLTDPQSFTGVTSAFTGPAGASYTIDDNSADYGTLAAGATGDCDGAGGDCYLLTVPGTRPSNHWDATFTETLSAGSIAKVWTLHIGDSFVDVPTSHQFYAYVENLVHNGITSGCSLTNYCPDDLVTRGQMAFFLMRGKLGTSHAAPAATGTLFTDVPSSYLYAPWIEELARYQITGGCGGGSYCPGNPVTRAQMAAFLLKAKHGAAYTPPPCGGIFGDVPCPSQFANWIEQLAAEGITGGCGGGNYCPGNPINRGQMAVFLVKAFGLRLYGPDAPRIASTNPYTVGVRVVFDYPHYVPHYYFAPGLIHIHAGDTITWLLGGHHSVQGTGFGSSGYPFPSQTYAHTFTQAGSFAYHCGVNHGFGLPHESGVVVVDP